jgi:hypothetical protein
MLRPALGCVSFPSILVFGQQVISTHLATAYDPADIKGLIHEINPATIPVYLAALCLLCLACCCSKRR